MASPESVWRDPQCAFGVVWAPEKLDQIRITIVDAFYALPRGGIEIGGILLGTFEEGLLRIDDWAAMECEHLTGPSFVLSDKDRGLLESQLARLGKKVVGWFHSHTRSELVFTPLDLDVHSRFFPEPWQVAMVLRPANLKPLRANYFFRAAGNALVAGESEFAVEATRGTPEALPETLPEPVAAPVPTPVQTPAVPVMAIPAVAPPPPRMEQVREPAFLSETQPVKQRSYLWLAALFAVAALGATGYFTQESWNPRPPEPLRLQASDVEGKLLVRWTPVRDAEVGDLRITDGGSPTDVKLDGLQLSRGLYLHVRKAMNETVRLKVGKREETTHFAGPLLESPVEQKPEVVSEAPVEKSPKPARKPAARRRR